MFEYIYKCINIFINDIKTILTIYYCDNVILSFYDKDFIEYNRLNLFYINYILNILYKHNY